MKKLQEGKIFFIIIICIASALRLWNYWNWSFSHDELGAFIRLDYNSFSEFIAKGVRDSDTHPALVQLLIWVWSYFFGLSEASIRLPFVLAGIGSVALLYLIAKKWFGFATARFSSLSLAILDFPILYSQLARPYSFGLFFSLLAVWCWTNLLFGSGRKIHRKAVFYGIATALCMLTHYFSFFFAMIVAVTGFFFLKRDTWKPYLLSGLIAFLIFVPHIPVSLHQFGMGGVGEWLGKPESDFLWTFILYALNNSLLVVSTMVTVSLFAVLMYNTESRISKFHFVCIVWFLLPFLAGYYYSIYVNAVLQYSTLLFSFPFLLLFLFSFFREGNKTINTVLLVALTVILLYSTIAEQNFYKREDFGVFKEINEAVIDLQKKHGSENITTVLNTSAKEIFDFYFERWGKNVSYHFYAGDSPAFVSDMFHKIESCTTSYFLYGWSNFRSPYEIPEMIKRKFPCIIYDEKHFNSQVTLFGRKDPCKRDTVFYSKAGFEKQTENFSYDSLQRDTTFFFGGRHSLHIESKNEFFLTFRSTVKQLAPDNTGCINVSSWIYPENNFSGIIVMEVGAPNSKKNWQGKDLKLFMKHSAKWQEVFVTFELPAPAYPDDEVIIYLWNSDKNNFYLDDFVVSTFADSKYNYYLPSFRK